MSGVALSSFCPRNCESPLPFLREELRYLACWGEGGGRGVISGWHMAGAAMLYLDDNVPFCPR